MVYMNCLEILRTIKNYNDYIYIYICIHIYLYIYIYVYKRYYA